MVARHGKACLSKRNKKKKEIRQFPRAREKRKASIAAFMKKNQAHQLTPDTFMHVPSNLRILYNF
jgi:hypothetical protein